MSWFEFQDDDGAHDRSVSYRLYQCESVLQRDV